MVSVITVAAASHETETAFAGSTSIPPPMGRSSAIRRLDLVTESVENLTHDLNNLLMSIANFTELALHHAGDEERRRNFESQVTELTFDAIGLVRHLRSVATSTSSERRSVAIADLLAPAVASMRAGFRQRRTVLELPATWPDAIVYVRPVETIQAIVDLLELARSTCVGAHRMVTLSVDNASSDAIDVLVDCDSSSIDAARLDVFEDLATSAGLGFDRRDLSARRLSLRLPRAPVDPSV